MKHQSKTLLQTVALLGICSVLLAACGNRDEAARAPAATTSVGTEIDDSVITARIKAALLADPDIKSLDIKIETRKGKAQLSGFVDTQARVDAALALVGRVEGVLAVENGMILKATPATVGTVVDDGIVTAKVKSALLADVNVKSLDISVVTNKGLVQLSGYVNNQAQIDRAVEIARGIEGAQSVGNEMTIKQ